MSSGLDRSPERVDSKVAALLVDSQIIQFYERQPHQPVREFQTRRILSLLAHAMEKSEWWRNRLVGAQREDGIHFADIPLMSRNEYRESSRRMAGRWAFRRSKGRRWRTRPPELPELR
jgi:hypothetical protein